MFWRTFVVIVLHFLSILFTASLCLKLGVISNVETQKEMEKIFERPSDDTVTAYSFVKQNFFYKLLAANTYEKRKEKKKNQKCLKYFQWTNITDNFQ